MSTLYRDKSNTKQIMQHMFTSEWTPYTHNVFFLYHCITYVFINSMYVLFIFLFNVYDLYRHVYYSAIIKMYVNMPHGSTTFWMLCK